MLDITISLEATCDLDKEVLEKYDLSVIDMNFDIDGKTFNTKNDDVVTTMLYEQMLQKKKTATSQINDFSYEEHFQKLLKKNKPILHLAFSSGLSGTIEVSRRVAEKLNAENENKIYVIDSLCACSGHGLYGIVVRDYANNCDTLDQLLEFAESIKHKIIHYFTVDSLSYLASGGRIDSKTAFFGNLLSIKPVMHMSKDGKLEVLHKVISRKKSLSSLADLTLKALDENYNYCFIAHANSLKDAMIVKEKIEANSSVKPVVTNLGPVIGSHSGPGTIAIFVVGKEER